MRHDLGVFGARLALFVLALVVCGWFLLGARAAHDQARVAALVQRSGSLSQHGSLTPAQVSRALRLLDHAATLSPDRGLDLLRAQVFLRTGDASRPVRILRGIVASEPSNIDAWVLLRSFLPPNDKEALIAKAHLRELAPPVPPPK
jgi:hypothetical protein